MAASLRHQQYLRYLGVMQFHRQFVHHSRLQAKIRMLFVSREGRVDALAISLASPIQNGELIPSKCRDRADSRKWMS